MKNQFLNSTVLCTLAFVTTSLGVTAHAANPSLIANPTWVNLPKCGGGSFSALYKSALYVCHGIEVTQPGGQKASADSHYIVRVRSVGPQTGLSFSADLHNDKDAAKKHDTAPDLNFVDNPIGVSCAITRPNFSDFNERYSFFGANAEFGAMGTGLGAGGIGLSGGCMLKGLSIGFFGGVGAAYITIEKVPPGVDPYTLVPKKN